MKKIAITLGDPNSISPEITIKALNFLDLPSEKITLIGNYNILNYYENHLGLSLEKNYELIEIPFCTNNIKIGEESAQCGEFSFQAIKKACELAISKKVDAIVTAPVSKHAMKLAGHNYCGQTEILEEYLARNNQKAEMIFVSDSFSLMLFTRHVALNKVSELIKKDLIISRIEQLIVSLKEQLNINSPSIALCALNPHAGENGMFGQEEIEEIIPAIEQLKKKGVNINGPFPSDALFANCVLNECCFDCYIAMYHDQGLIPMKLLAGKNAVNTTLGLDVLRTSPAHGTAFDIAGKNEANTISMIKAIKLAIK